MYMNLSNAGSEGKNKGNARRQKRTKAGEKIFTELAMEEGCTGKPFEVFASARRGR